MDASRCARWPRQSCAPRRDRGIRHEISCEPSRSTARFSVQQFAHLAQSFEYLCGFALVDHGEGKADMDKHIIVHSRLGHKGETDLLDDAAEIDAADPCQWILSRHAQKPPRNR